MVQRRYTPPTCTLEVRAKTPLLFRGNRGALLKSLEFSLVFDDPRLPEAEYVTLKGNQNQLVALHQAVSDYVEDFLSSTTLSPNLEEKEETEHLPSLEPRLRSSSDIYLKPRGLLIHDLFLGQLVDETSKPVVHLTPTQLFDLATALDEYAMDIIVSRNIPKKNHKKHLPVWLNVAAITLVAVGLTASVAQVIENRGRSENAMALKSVKPLSLPSPGISFNTQKMPGLIPANPQGINSPKPLIPPPPIMPTPNGTLPPVVIKSSPINKPTPLQAPLPVFPPANPNSGKVEQEIAIPGDGGVTFTTPPTQEMAVEPQSPPSESVAVSRERIPSPPLPPPPPPGVGIDPLSNTPENITLPSLEDASISEESPELAASRQNPDQMAIKKTGDKPTLFDTIPQVSEVRNYFQENWKPPKKLTETLQYSLQLDPNGSIELIFPLGSAAGEFIDRTNMPLVGEPFVSARTDGKRPKIRLLLKPNGKVQTFLESLN